MNLKSRHQNHWSICSGLRWSITPAHTDKNAFYRLKNRLIEDINKSLFLQEFQSDDVMLSFYFVSLGHYYYNRNQYGLALYNFRRAEKKAKELEDYGLLDIIYAKLIRTSQEILSGNPEEYIRKRSENRKALNKLSELHDVLEAVEYRIKLSQNLTSNKNINELLKITVNDFADSADLKESSRLQFGIYQVVSRIFLQNHDYQKLEEYLIETYTIFERKKFFNKSNHGIKLEMLSWMANSLFKNKKFQASLEYAELLKKEMDRFDKMLYERFEFFYYNILIINFTAINPSKTIELLLGLTEKEKLNQQPIYRVFIYSNLSIQYYQQKEFKKALKYLNELYRYEGFRNIDELLKLKLAMGELIIRYELKEKDILEYRHKQILKDFSQTLDRIEITWEKDFMKIFHLILSTDLYKQLPGFMNQTKAFLEKTKQIEGTDEMLFSYDKWLRQKTNL